MPAGVVRSKIGEARLALVEQYDFAKTVYGRHYGGQSIQKGFWKDLMPFLNRLELDHLILGFARRGYDELDAFRELKPEIALGIGVIDIKDNEVESHEQVAKRVEHARASARGSNSSAFLITTG